MAIIFIRTVILYFAILISMRVMGKRQLGELEISEFIRCGADRGSCGNTAAGYRHTAFKRAFADPYNVLP